MAADETGKSSLAEELAADFAAVEAWWREAGVDTDFSDEPRQWLAPAEAAPAEPGAKAPSATAEHGAKPEATSHRRRLGNDPEQWPQSLAGFADWWLTEPSLGLAGDGRRVLPRGAAGAELMVLVPQPEPGDDKRLLSGREGLLLTAILAALGLSEERTYLASVLPAHVGPIDWVLLQEGRMAAVLEHHLRLAAPKRLLVLGREGVASLLGHDLTDFGLASAHFDHLRLGLRIAYAPELAGLLERPSRKEAVWRLLLDWGG